MPDALTDDIFKHPLGKKRLSSKSGLLLRTTIVACAALASLGCAGIVFGFSAIHPVLLEEGVFNDDCRAGSVCKEQKLQLNYMFTLASTAVNVWGLPGGFILDKLGPKLSALSSCLLVAVGCVLFANGGPGNAGLLYYGGFLLMGIGGPSIFVSTVSFSSLFPQFPGLVTAACVGCFDASCFAFVMLAAFWRSGVPLTWLFAGYAAVPTFFALCVVALWPNEPVQPVDDEDDKADVGLDDDEGFYSLDHLGLLEQVKSAEFFLVTYAVSAHMLMLNFFIGTADEQLQQLNEITRPRLNQAFSTMLPAGGLFWIPLIGRIIDKCSVAGSWAILWSASCCFMLTFFVHSQTPDTDLSAYIAFTIFSFCRPLLYTLGANFTGHMFGFRTFGTIYGLIFTLAGAFNTLVAGLTTLAHRTGFQAVNWLVFAILLLAGACPALVYLRNRRCQRRREAMHMEDVISQKVNLSPAPSPVLSPAASPRRRASLDRQISMDLRYGMLSPGTASSRPSSRAISLMGTPLLQSDSPLFLSEDMQTLRI